MKICISGSSVRLRLSQSEVTLYIKDGVVCSECNFESGILKYQIQHGDFPCISAKMYDQTITVSVPTEIAANWDKDIRVGFDTKDNSGLYTFVEKDFQCLKSKSYEDECDIFPNPQTVINTYG